MNSVRRGRIRAQLFLVRLLSLADVPQQGQQLPCLTRSLREGSAGSSSRASRKDKGSVGGAGTPWLVVTKYGWKQILGTDNF